MADPIALSTLVERAQNSINAPGAEFITATDDQWVKYLATSFWETRIFGFFPGFRVNDSYELVNVDDSSTVEIAEHELTIITMMARLRTIEAKLLEMPTSVSGKGGPVEGEVQRSAQVLMALLKAAREDMQTIKDELSTQGGARTSYVIDKVISSIDQLNYGASIFVN